MFKTVGNVKFFTEIDLSSAYHHIKVEEDSQPLLGFVNPQGIQYVWMRLSFSLKGAVTHFQAQGEKMILEIKNVISYLNNFLVASQMFKSHCKSVKRVIEALIKAGFQINHKKYKFLMKKLKFIGHLIDGNSCLIDSHKIKVAAKIAHPVTGKQVEQMLSFFNFLRDFIPNFASIAALLEKLRKLKKITFTWGKAEEKAFRIWNMW